MPARAAIYLDSNAGAPLRPQVVKALLPFFKEGLLANPSSPHAPGRRARKWLTHAREQVALSLGPGVRPEALTFTSSGTEAAQLAIRSILEPALKRKRSSDQPVRWLMTPAEHDCVISMASWFRSQGGEVDLLPLNAHGAPDASQVGAFWSSETCLLSALWVNNETGVITDVQALASAVTKQGGLLHLDAAQAWGKLQCDPLQSGAALVSFSGHKIGTFAGAGVLWQSEDVGVLPVILGAQQTGRRGGTESSLNWIGLGAAAEAIDTKVWDAHVRPLRDLLEQRILERISGARINGVNGPRVGNTSSISFSRIGSAGLVAALDLEGFAVSAGSACSSGSEEPSHVLQAMGVSREEALSSLRVSLWDGNTLDELELFVQALERCVSRLGLC